MPMPENSASTATCPMCGHANAIPPPASRSIESDEPIDSPHRQCESCGERLRVAEAETVAPTSGVWERRLAAAFLALIGALFVLALLFALT